jgi:hypothetical protein
MAKKRRGEDPGDGLERVFAELEGAPLGLHDLEPAASALPSGLPPSLIDLYSHCDGLRLFHDTVIVGPPTEVTMAVPGRWRFGELEGDALAVDHRGKIWRADTSLDDDVCDGTRLDRWLAGVVDALALLYDADGEFEDVFDEHGEVLPEIRERKLRAQLKRDPAAPGPRWRLAHALLEQGAQEDARNELEQVVADDPRSRGRGSTSRSRRRWELGNAVDEARMGAETAGRAARAGRLLGRSSRGSRPYG